MRIGLITIVSDNVPAMVGFYRDVLGFPVQDDMDGYVEFVSEGVRFAVCAASVMANAVRHPSYAEPRRGQSFELSFPLSTPADVDRAYGDLVARGAVAVQGPANMPWRQRTAFFADPDGNIHELFADLPAAREAANEAD